jgi:uncharacterized protein (DUF305 family)
MRAAALGLAALLALTACDGGGDPVEQALRETAAANHSAVTQETASVEHAGHSAQSGPGGDRAFAASEAAMHAGMTAASGDTVDEAYIAKMIEHRRGAVAMADVALARATDPEVRRMAQAVKDTQTREIEEMQAWRPSDQSAVAR